MINYHKVYLKFQDVRFSVETSKTKAALLGGKAGNHEILKGISGAVESGQILAIIGSSGAGKTSLLDVLVGKVRALLLLLEIVDVCVARGQIVTLAIM